MGQKWAKKGLKWPILGVFRAKIAKIEDFFEEAKMILHFSKVPLFNAIEKIYKYI